MLNNLPSFIGKSSTAIILTFLTFSYAKNYFKADIEAIKYKENNKFIRIELIIAGVLAFFFGLIFFTAFVFTIVGPFFK